MSNGSTIPKCYFLTMTWGENCVSYHLRALAAELAARGHRVVILVDQQNRAAESHHTNPAVYTWPSRRPTKWRDARFLYKLIRKYRPDCLMAAFGAATVMTWVGRLLRVPCRVAWYLTVSEAIDLDTRLSPWRLRLLRLRKRITYRLATHISPNAQAGSDDIQRVYGVPGHKCRVNYLSLPDPVGQAVWPRQTNGQGRPICVGRIAPTKGQDVLIRAVALLKDSLQLSVEFVGDGPARAACEHLARDLGVDDRCDFTGAVPHEEVLRKMAAASVTVVPSRNECFGLVNVESLAVGTPVIASEVGGIGEIFRDGVEGFLVPPDDPAVLAEKLKRLLENPELRAEMGRKARKRFTKFEQSGVVRTQADWLEQITTAACPAAGNAAGKQDFAPKPQVKRHKAPICQ